MIRIRSLLSIVKSKSELRDRAAAKVRATIAPFIADAAAHDTPVVDGSAPDWGNGLVYLEPDTGRFCPAVPLGVMDDEEPPPFDQPLPDFSAISRSR